MDGWVRVILMIYPRKAGSTLFLYVKERNSYKLRKEAGEPFYIIYDRFMHGNLVSLCP